MTAAHGDEVAADVALAFCAEVRTLLDAHAAAEVKTMGDAMMIAGRDAALAVGLSVQIVRDLGHQHAALGVRIGLHTGSAVRRDGDWFGSSVTVRSVACRAR